LDAKGIKKPNKIIKYIYFFCIISYVNASTPIDKALNNNILFEKQKEQFKKMEENSNKKIPYYEIEKPKIIDKKEGKCIEIKKIEENTITLLSDKEKNSIFQAYEGTCRTLTELNNLTKELMHLYIDKGYITSKVYFKPQKMDKGILEIYAIEGKIAKITPKETYIKNAFIFQEGKYLNLRDLESSIETINKLSSNHATMKLIPGERLGTTNIQIDNNVTNRINGNIGVDNFGDKRTGRVQANLTLNIDNLLGINDQLSINLNTTQKHTTNQNSKGYGYQYSFPLGGKFSTTFKYRKTTYEQLIPAGATDFKSTGLTNTYTLNLAYKIFHNQNNRVNAGVSITHFKSENFISDALIETSSYKISNAGINFDYLYQVAGFYSFLALSYNKGTHLLGYHNPTDLNERASFYTIDLSLMKQIFSLKYTLNAHYQHANDALFSINQISIGGPYSVRGYKEEGLSGNTGYYARNELSKMLETKFLYYFKQTYFIALDSGWIKKETGVNNGKLLSYSLGVKYEKGNYSTQLYYAIPLRTQDVTQTSKVFGISMSYKY
jgi:hemolysin activation/secretion protein